MKIKSKAGIPKLPLPPQTKEELETIQKRANTFKKVGEMRLRKVAVPNLEAIDKATNLNRTDLEVYFLTRMQHMEYNTYKLDMAMPTSYTPDFWSPYNAELLQKLSHQYPDAPFDFPLDIATKTPTIYCVETKGYFRPENITKMKHFLHSWKGVIKILFIFANPHQKIRRGQKMTYAMWCEKLGQDWCSIRDFDRPEFHRTYYRMFSPEQEAEVIKHMGLELSPLELMQHLRGIS